MNLYFDTFNYHLEAITKGYDVDLNIVFRQIDLKSYQIQYHINKENYYFWPIELNHETFDIHEYLHLNIECIKYINWCIAYHQGNNNNDEKSTNK